MKMIVAKVKHQQVFNMGDFIVQIRNHLPGNKETMSKEGRQLKRKLRNILRKYKWKHWKGKWTREQGEERSIIDAVITTGEYVETKKPKKRYLKNTIKEEKR